MTRVNTPKLASLYMKAAEESKHQWKQRQLVADVARCYFEQRNWVTAAKRFLNVIAFDEATPSYDAIPLFWKATPLDTATTAQALQWLEDERPVAGLIAGSWLLNVPEHAAAAKTKLQSLTEHKDQRVAALATAQLWRLQLAGVTAAEVARWETLLQKMPSQTRAGGWHMLAQGYARINQPKLAAAAALRVPVHFPNESFARRRVVVACRCAT